MGTNNNGNTAADAVANNVPPAGQAAEIPTTDNMAGAAEPTKSSANTNALAITPKMRMLQKKAAQRIKDESCGSTQKRDGTWSKGAGGPSPRSK